MRLPSPFSVLLLTLLGATAAQARPMKLCSEPGDGPPWLYWVKDEQGKPTGELAGFNADLWPAVFKRLGLQAQLLGELPWKRCLRAVASGEVDFAIGAYRDREREQIFAYSAPYRVLTPQVFYSARRPIKVQSRADLKRYKGCGMNGSSYAHYDLGENWIDQGARSYTTLVAKLLKGNCDYFVEELEVISEIDGGRQRYLESTELLHAPVPDAPAPALHAVAAKGSVAAALLPKIDAAVAEMKKSGEFARLWKKNAGDLPF